MSKVGVVTGGARGIGEQICRQLHSHGVKIIIVDVLEEEGQALANQLQGSIFKCMDVSKIENWKNLVKEVEKIDYLFLNAAILSKQGVSFFQLLQQKPDQIEAMHLVQRVMEVNFFQTVYGVGTFIPIMQEGGSIMVTSSMVGLMPWPQDPIYAATKHAIIGYMRSVKKCLNELGIKSYEACLGVVNTDLTGVDRDKLPFWRLDPEVVAEAMVDLVLSGKPSQTVTIMAGRDPILQEQKEFVKLFESYDVEQMLKPED
eukprot:TRINITY_DN50532_c0_g1_i1.p1 TRINITY_DN50532_c0_g1~~TRINITY_DN50532_c0_g1_i1.p1  ORF type:complete len:281 (+),score=25.41 TRINITY_DN50532_c0_g1_i1:72-845(+)